ncbi:MAG: 50S ribosomal protein L30e [Desulfurococcales archaeon]|nr:50S ribosomal protein L30e [Desulfurococcales archaeon]
MSLSFERELGSLLKTGKYVIGSRKGLRALLRGEAKMVILASNAPPEVKKRVEYYARLSNVPVYVFRGTNVDLGVVAGKPFRISMIVVIDEGSSRILELSSS